MTKPSIAVLGTGRIGKMHAELIDRQVPGLDLHSVFDVYTEGARAVADDLGCELAGSAEEVMSSDVDAVAICTSCFFCRASRVFCSRPISNCLSRISSCACATKRLSRLHLVKTS